jgi:hypothetical protein
MHRAADPATRQHATCIGWRKVTGAELHTLCTQGCGDIRASTDEHRSLRWTRE